MVRGAAESILRRRRCLLAVLGPCGPLLSPRGPVLDWREPMSAESRLGSNLLVEVDRRLGLVPEQAGLLLLLPGPVAVALEVDGGGVMEQPVQDGEGLVVAS